jgi:hypothetical protein
LEVEELQWGTTMRVKVLVSMPFVAVLTGAVLAGGGLSIGAWSVVVVTGLAAYLLGRGGGARLTEDELVLRYPVGSRRIPRSEVVSARFTRRGMQIKLRDGSKVFAFLRLEWISAEPSSGGVPRRRSAAYRITEWAAGR